MAIDLKATQLLASRLCHDLVGPLAAVNAGVELIGEESGGGGGGNPNEPPEEVLALIGSSAAAAAARLSFFRLAFGAGGSGGGGSGGSDAHMKDAEVLTRDFLAGGRVILDWQFSDAAAPEIPLPGVKLLLNMVLLGVEALPRGGRLTVLTVTAARPGAEYRLRVLAVGDGARFGGASLAVFSPDPDEKALKLLDARTIVAHFAATQAQALGATLEATTDEPGRVGFQALVSAT